MNRDSWRDEVKAKCIDLGTYRESFDPVIETLAVILERRDKAEEQFAETGGNVVVGKQMTNGGGMRFDMNPVLKVINELNRDALAYWRDLGLTPAGLKRLNAEVIVKADTGFEAFLSKVMDE